MPYYCTVPRCTSMAGKAKNVSFHQFPRDEELAKLWNKILKRGKPYTKYSKVCSLHFRPEDYTITSVGKNKGQWRTLRKDAIPSQNLPSESPVTTPRRSSGAWAPNNVSGVVDPRMQQQMAQAIYLQTMLAMQAANGSQLPTPLDAKIPTNVSTASISDIEQLLQTRKTDIEETNHQKTNTVPENHESNPKNMSYKCTECSKCFKDPDVFVLHKRTHSNKIDSTSLAGGNEKENINANNDFSSQETLRANPILANLLKSGVPPSNLLTNIPEMSSVFDANNILSIENQIMTALAANMENYFRNISSLLTTQPKNGRDIDEVNTDPEKHDPNQEGHNSDEHSHNMYQDDQNSDKDDENSDFDNDYLEQIDSENHEDLFDRKNDIVRNGHSSDQSVQNFVQDSDNIDEDDHNSDRNKENNQVDDHNSYNNSQNNEDVQNFVAKGKQCHQDTYSADSDGVNYKEIQRFEIKGQNSHQDGHNSDNDCQNYNQYTQNTDYNNQNYVQDDQKNCNDGQSFDEIGLILESKGSKEFSEPYCDIEDLNQSKDSNLLIDDTV